jgi:hypothetical protein
MMLVIVMNHGRFTMTMNGESTIVTQEAHPGLFLSVRAGSAVLAVLFAGFAYWRIRIISGEKQDDAATKRKIPTIAIVWFLFVSIVLIGLLVWQPNQSSDPTPAPVTPAAGQPSRQP